MKIKRLKIDGFGRYKDYTVDFSEGLNVIYGLNESGKSTLTAFLICMMFDTAALAGNEFSKELEKKYEPWDYDKFGGEIYFYHEGVNYLLKKTFGLTRRTQLFNADTNAELYPAGEYFEKMFPGLTPLEYLNTYFNSVDNQEMEPSIIQSVRKHAARNSLTRSSDIDAGYAISILEERRHQLQDVELAGRIKSLEELIKSEEATERELDKIAYKELRGIEEIENINIELEKYKKPTAFENEEQEYYRNKERYLTYKNDLAKSRELSDELEKTIIISSELEENANKLNRCKDELALVRKFVKRCDEEVLNTRHDVSSLKRQLSNESRSINQKRIAGLIVAILSTLFGIFALVEKISPIYYLLAFTVALFGASFFIYAGIKGHRQLTIIKDQLDRAGQDEANITRKRVDFFRAHSSENELMERLEMYLKEDGRRPDISRKEEELSKECSELDVRIKIKHKELLGFFSKFGGVEDLKDDELKLQEEALILKKETRENKVKELEEKLTGLKEAMIKMHMQVEAGEENEAKLLAHREELKGLKEKKEMILKEEKAIKLASDIITMITKEGSEGVTKVINQVASSYAAAFTEGHYTSVITDESMHSKVDYYDKYVEDKALSTGTKSQLNLAVRLSAGDIILGDYNLPMVFDDAFVYYDDERLAETLKTINNHSGQSFIFTCMMREDTILSQLTADYKLITL